jgi:glucosamine--fructose-6-phosphate aminotransferase (isomerizing)
MVERGATHAHKMYEAIRRQPECIARMLDRQRERIAAAAEAAAERHRIVLLGIGSSYHAAQLGENFLRHFTHQSSALVEQSFEQVHYPRQFRPDHVAVCISHRGTHNHTVQAMQAAQAAGALTIALCGHPVSDEMATADFAIATCEMEECFAHTKSYTAAAAALALWSICLAARRGYISREDAQGATAALERIPGLMQQALACESQAREAAKKIATRQRWVFIGAGPNWATAREGALKVKETSYLAAEGFQTEQFIHGPLAELDSRGVLTAILAGGPGDHRTAGAVRAAGEVGALRVVIAAHGAQGDLDGDALLEVPQAGEWLSPFLQVVPVQLLAYFVALERGTNPDTGRLHEPAHARAQEHLKL